MRGRWLRPVAARPLDTSRLSAARVATTSVVRRWSGGQGVAASIGLGGSARNSDTFPPRRLCGPVTGGGVFDPPVAGAVACAVEVAAIEQPAAEQGRVGERMCAVEDGV